MSLSLVRSALSGVVASSSQMSLEAWLNDQQLRGEKVKLFRQYAEGDHRANLTPEMRRLLRVSAGSLNEFNDNFMDAIIQAMNDRLTVEQITADNEAASKWSAEWLKLNRFDGLQGDVHEAAIRDGDAYLMVYFDNADERAKWSLEPAYDGTSGMLVLYETAASPLPSLAVKIWHITLSGEKIADTMRVNVYYPDRIERFITVGAASAALAPYDLDGNESVMAWGLPGQPLGVPVVHFRNRRSMYDNYGMSELENAIPLQDALNRTLYSMVMAAELTAFQIRYAVGWSPPAALTPGMWLRISESQPLSPDEKIDVGALEQGELAPYLEMALYLKGEIGDVTNTPRLTPHGQGGAAASGEALKQREIGLVGKCQRFQTKAGNAWEDVVGLAHRVETAYTKGDKPPAAASWNTRWKSAEVRNNAELVKNAVEIADRVDQRTFLEIVAPAFGWDAAQIDTILERKESESQQKMTRAVNALPNFNAFNPGETMPGTNGMTPGQDMPAAGMPQPMQATRQGVN